MFSSMKILYTDMLTKVSGVQKIVNIEHLYFVPTNNSNRFFKKNPRSGSSTTDNFFFRKYLVVELNLLGGKYF